MVVPCDEGSVLVGVMGGSVGEEAMVEETVVMGSVTVVDSTVVVCVVVLFESFTFLIIVLESDKSCIAVFNCLSEGLKPRPFSAIGITGEFSFLCSDRFTSSDGAEIQNEGKFKSG